MRAVLDAVSNTVSHAVQLAVPHAVQITGQADCLTAVPYDCSDAVSKDVPYHVNDAVMDDCSEAFIATVERGVQTVRVNAVSTTVYGAVLTGCCHGRSLAVPHRCTTGRQPGCSDLRCKGGWRGGSTGTSDARNGPVPQPPPRGLLARLSDTRSGTGRHLGYGVGLRTWLNSRVDGCGRVCWQVRSVACSRVLGLPCCTGWYAVAHAPRSGPRWTGRCVPCPENRKRSPPRRTMHAVQRDVAGAVLRRWNQTRRCHRLKSPNSGRPRTTLAGRGTAHQRVGKANPPRGRCAATPRRSKRP